MKLITIPKKYIASFLALVMVFGVFVFVAPVEAQAVEINANATGFGGGLYYSDESGVTNFVNGAAIKVVNLMRTSKNEATYTTTDGTNWTTTDAMVWNSSSKNKFQAYYPVAEYSSYDMFTIPTDQSDATKLASADWMTASTGEIDKPENGVLDLSFQHRLAKVTVTVSEFASQYAEGATLSGATIYSLTADNVSVENANNGVTPYQEGNSVTAIVCPGKYNADATLMEINVKDENGDYTLAVPVNDYLVDTGLAAGSHYTFSLKVGKDVVAISSVTVEGWVEMEIDGGVAEEVFPSIDAAAMNTDELNAAVSRALAAGETDIRIKLAEDADATMFSAITAALAADGIEEGSIDLTISGAKTVPKYGFFDYDDYSDNDDKNIAGDKLKSLTLTDVETIGKYAFSACTYLESVNLPQVVTIGECAFNEWEKGTKLTSLNLPNATTIGEWAFAYSSLLTSINLPKVTNIGMFAFGYCDLRTLNLPEVTTIDGEAFLNNYNLVYCSAPKATTIDYYPWGNCSKLETLELTAAGGFTLGNNLFANTPTGQINLVLNKDKESQVTQNGDGTATWKTTNSNGGKLEYTFKSITFVGE